MRRCTRRSARTRPRSTTCSSPPSVPAPSHMQPPKLPTWSEPARGGAMLDFGALPPEINSARMYAGPGSGPMLAAAAAWQELAVELNSAAAHYGSLISGLTGGAWAGPSAVSMAAAATPYVGWLAATAGQAEQAAAQAATAAAAYETAFAATVPPPVIAANRSLLG